MKSMIQALATLLLLGIVLTGCSEDLWFQDGNAKEGTYTMTVQASDSRWDRYLGMTAPMTQVPVPTATTVPTATRKL